MPRRKFVMPDGATLFEQVTAIALANAKAGRRVRAGDAQKRVETAKRNRKARQRVAANRWHEERRAKHRARQGVFGERWEDRCVRAMVPGEWYADRDLQIAMGAGEDHPVQVAPVGAGLIERRRNPDWKGQNRYGEMQAPKWLYRLTPAGEARRELCLMLGYFQK